MLASHTGFLTSFILIAIEILGILAAINAIMQGRTPQGAIAWAISLIIFPYISLPLYLVFGSRKFTSYIRTKKIVDRKIKLLLSELFEEMPSECILDESEYKQYKAIKHLAKVPFTKCNDAELLIDGINTFNEIFRAIDSANNYILVQFYIVKDDDLGNELKKRLIKKAKEGLDVYFIYDEIGSYKLSESYIDDLENSGIQAKCFKTTMGWKNRFRLNFRNHRKIVVIDGKIAFIGGHNVGDEYVGKSKRFKHWRDTHVKIEGPAVRAAQLSFVEDWYWITHDLLKLNWNIHKSDKNKRIAILPSGPSDKYETCGLFFMNTIFSAKKRIWIVSPYFVPDSAIVSALQLAALRGVDVRIMLPEKSDYILIHLSSYSYVNELSQSNIHFFRYKEGFLHQKVLLVDDETSIIGTANFDNRSFRINFEITAIIIDKNFAQKTENMLTNDFSKCGQIVAQDYYNRPLWFKIAVNIARLFSPIE